MEPQEIKKITEDALAGFMSEKSWVDKDYLNRYLNSIVDLRKFFQDIITLSIGIVGLIIPILINSNIILNRITLFLSGVLFVVEIILGILTRFFVIKKEVKKWPIVQKDIENKFDQTVSDMQEIINNPKENLFNDKINIIKERYTKKDDIKNKESLLDRIYLSIANIFNIDNLLLGLFIVAFVLFIVSFYPLLRVYLLN